MLIPTLHARLELIERIVAAESVNSKDFEETLLREDLALMDAESLLGLADDLL